VPGYGLNAVIFAREISDPLTSLVKQMDQKLETAARRVGQEHVGVFIVFCNDNPQMAQRLQALAGKEGIKHVVLCTTNSAGPQRYRLAGEADLTALIYGGGLRKVAANFALLKGQLDEKRTKDILESLSQVLPR
jgi:hypothetical protein